MLLCRLVVPLLGVWAVGSAAGGGNATEMHKHFKGLTRAAVEEAGWAEGTAAWNAHWFEVYRRQWTPHSNPNPMPGQIKMMYRINYGIYSIRLLVTAVSFVGALIVHRDKANKDQLKSFFFTFILWDLGLQAVLNYYSWLSTTVNLFQDQRLYAYTCRYVRPSPVPGTWASDCPFFHWLFLSALNPDKLAPRYIATWVDLAVVLDRCVGLTWPLQYRKHFASPTSRARRWFMPLFLVHFVALHQILGHKVFGAGNYLHFTLTRNYSLSLLSDSPTIRTFGAAYVRPKNRENSTFTLNSAGGVVLGGIKMTIYNYTTLQFLPQRREFRHHMFQVLDGWYTAYLWALLWLWLAVKIVLMRRAAAAAEGAQGLAGAEAEKERKRSNAAVRMLAVYCLFDIFYVAIARAKRECRDYVGAYRTSMLTSSDFDWVDNMLSLRAFCNDLTLPETILKSSFCLNWVLLLALSASYRRLALGTARKHAQKIRAWFNR